MAKKQKVTVPTGDYSIRMPSVVSITGDAPVIQNTKEVNSGSLVLKIILRLTVVFLLSAGVFTILAYRGVIRVPTIEEILTYFRRTPPGDCCNRVRYVIVGKTYLFERPQEYCYYYYYYDRPRYVLRYGDPVEEMNQTHQFPNGCIWIKVRYIHVAAAHQESREGWVDARDVTIQ
ncbi:MAG: hypothetical protein ACKVX9_10660 [Blastocatellia bacterium]